MWHTIKSWFSKKETTNPGWYKKVVAVHGETEPGVLSIGIGSFDENGPLPIGGETVQWKITPAARASVNRVLAGLGTDEDFNVIELAIAALL